MSSSRASVSQFDSLMEGVISSSGLLASAATSATPTLTAVDETAFKAAVEENLQNLDLKMSFKNWESLDSDAKAVELANNITQVAHDEYISLSTGAGTSAEETAKNAVIISQAMKPKFQSTCGAAIKQIMNQFEEFLAAEEETAATEQARMSLEISKAALSVHHKFLAPATTGAGEIKDEDLRQAEAKFRSDTTNLHSANYAAAYQVQRTEKAAAALNEATAAGATADELTSCEKKLHANERLSQGLLKKRNDIAMEVLGRNQAAPKANYRATASALLRIKELKLENDQDYSKRSNTIVRDLKDALVEWIVSDVDATWALAPTIARLKEHGIAQWSVIYNKQITATSTWKQSTNTAEENRTALMAAMDELGFIPSEPPATLKADAAYNKKEDDAQQVAFAVKAYLSQNGTAFDAMRGGVGVAVDNAVTRTGRYMGDRSDGRRSETESGDILSIIESWLLWCETFGSFTKDDVQDSIRHAVGFLVLDDWRQGVKKFQEQIRQAQALKIELTFNQTVFRYLYELRRERDAVTTRLEVEWGRLPTGMTHTQNFIGRLNLFVGDFQRIMQDASDVERKLNDNDRFKKRRRQLVHRVQMFTDEDNESDEDDDDDEEDTVQQLSTFGGHVNRGNKGLGLPDQNKSVKEYSDFNEREIRMGTYKKNDKNQLRKCCDVDRRCKGPKPDCNNTLLSIDEYNGFRAYIGEKDKMNHSGKTVGYYYWAICNKCQAWCKTHGKSITMGDDFSYPHKAKDGGKSFRQKRKDKIALIASEQNTGPPAGAPAAAPAPAPAPAAIEPPPQPGTALGHWVVDPPPPPTVPAGSEARWVASPAPAPFEAERNATALAIQASQSREAMQQQQIANLTLQRDNANLRANLAAEQSSNGSLRGGSVKNIPDMLGDGY